MPSTIILIRYQYTKLKLPYILYYNTKGIFSDVPLLSFWAAKVSFSSSVTNTSFRDSGRPCLQQQNCWPERPCRQAWDLGHSHCQVSSHTPCQHTIVQGDPLTQKTETCQEARKQNRSNKIIFWITSSFKKNLFWNPKLTSGVSFLSVYPEDWALVFVTSTSHTHYFNSDSP